MKVEFTEHGTVRYMVEDKCMFEIKMGADKVSIEVRAPEFSVRAKDRIYQGVLQIEPHVSNVVAIRLKEFEGAQSVLRRTWAFAARRQVSKGPAIPFASASQEAGEGDRQVIARRSNTCIRRTRSKG